MRIKHFGYLAYPNRWWNDHFDSYAKIREKRENTRKIDFFIKREKVREILFFPLCKNMFMHVMVALVFLGARVNWG